MVQKQVKASEGVTTAAENHKSLKVLMLFGDNVQQPEISVCTSMDFGQLEVKSPSELTPGRTDIHHRYVFLDSNFESKCYI